MAQNYFLAHERLNDLFSLFHSSGYVVIAPQLEDGAIVYRQINNSEALPWGITDEQKPGYYRLTNKSQDARQGQAFGFTLPEQTVKSLLFKPKEILWQVTRDGNGKLAFKEVYQSQKQVIFGIRPCDLKAIAIQDRVFIHDTYQDPHYQQHRNNSFLVAMNCTASHDNCFCLSMGGSPQATASYDLAMTEIEGGFVVQAGHQTGLAYLEQLSLPLATDIQYQSAQNGIENAVNTQTKSIPSLEKVERGLYEHQDHPQWQDVGSRCLSCGSCTQACPTCFCHQEKDEPQLDGYQSLHFRQWDSCFSLGHSYMHSEIVRDEVSQRYRQWLTHKFSTWRDQFGTEGCVGCGRCITWCPVKIDITDEIKAIVNENNK